MFNFTNHIFLCVFSLFTFASNITYAHQISSDDYSVFTNPTNEPSKSIGSYANGCIQGALALPDDLHYKLVYPSRNRYWGHGITIDFIKNLSRDIYSTEGNGLLIGDLSQPRGGPMTWGHKSHQTGLDVDIYFEKKPQDELSDNDLIKLALISLLDKKQENINQDIWSKYYSNLLQRVSDDANVSRVFVNPIIKNQLCLDNKGDRSWLGKIRPWGGHYEHFHVRLKCDKNSEECIEQHSVPTGDGCGKELDNWLEKGLKVYSSNKKPIIPKELFLHNHPISCMALFDDLN